MGENEEGMSQEGRIEQEAAVVGGGGRGHHLTEVWLSGVTRLQAELRVT